MSTSVTHDHREYNPTNQPFGTYALSPLQAAVRNLSLRRPSAWLGRSLRFFLRRWLPENRPYDVIAFGGSRVRLHVGDNKCERKMLFNPANWDARERDRLADMLEDYGDEPFYFVDVGSNAGLYSLFVEGAAKRLGRLVRILAIEPDPAMRGRFEFNMRYSSSLSITLLPYAVAAARTEEKLFINSVNRGENSLSGEGESIAVSGRPLGELLLEQEFPRVDAMKIDIEGHEYPALKAFYRDADPRLWPRVLILEAVHIDPRESPIELCLQRGYRLIEETKMNVVLERSA